MTQSQTPPIDEINTFKEFLVSATKEAKKLEHVCRRSIARPDITFCTVALTIAVRFLESALDRLQEDPQQP